jgi:hypothetical protein
MTKNSSEDTSSSVLLDVEDFLTKYQQGHVLGKGGFGSVRSGIQRCDHLPIAIKYIRKRDIIAWGTVITFYSLTLLEFRNENQITSLNSNDFNVVLIELNFV